MHVQSWESMRKAFERQEETPATSLASRVRFQLPKYIYLKLDRQHSKTKA